MCQDDANIANPFGGAEALQAARVFVKSLHVLILLDNEMDYSRDNFISDLVIAHCTMERRDLSRPAWHTRRWISKTKSYIRIDILTDKG